MVNLTAMNAKAALKDLSEVKKLPSGKSKKK